MKVLFFILNILPLCALSQDSLSNHYKIYSVSKQKEVTLDDIADDMANADVLFFGEDHNDSTGHYLEYTLFKKLAKKYPDKIALSMEMFETDCQNVLNEYLDGLIPEKYLTADAHPWPNYKDYRPMIEWAKTNHIPVIAANAPSRYVNMVNRLGLSSLEQLSKTGKSYLPPLPVDTATGDYYQKFLNVMGGHAAMGGMHLFQSQNLWDATMGWSIARFAKKHKGYKTLQLNGGFHSEEKLGTVAQLKKYDKKLRVLNIATFCDDNFFNPDWGALGKNGDYIIVTDPKLPKTY
jgi:uncharacterized iron-regulated protein